MPPSFCHRPALRRLLAATLLLAAAQPALGQAGLRWRGAVEAGVVDAQAREHAALNPDGRLLQPERQWLGVSVNFKGQASTGAWRAVADTWLEARRDRVARSDEQRADLAEGWLEYAATDTTSVAAGVGQARWGTGYSWNPANPVLDPDANNSSRARSYRRNGDGFVRVETVRGKDTAGLYLTRFRQNDPLQDPLRDRQWSLYGRYQHVLDTGDVTGFAALGERGERFAGLAASATVSDELAVHGELGLRNRRQSPRAGSVDVPLGGGAMLALPTWDSAARRTWTPSLLLGGQYTFANRTNVIAEVLYNGNGYDRGEYRDLQRGIAAGQALAGTPLAAAGDGFLLDSARLVGRLRRHYLFVRVAADEAARDLDLHYYLRLGIADGAAVHGVYLKRAFGQRARLLFTTEFYAGPPAAETRLIPIRHRSEATLSIDF